VVRDHTCPMLIGVINGRRCIHICPIKGGCIKNRHQTDWQNDKISRFLIDQKWRHFYSDLSAIGGSADRFTYRLRKSDNITTKSESKKQTFAGRVLGYNQTALFEQLCVNSYRLFSASVQEKEAARKKELKSQKVDTAHALSDV